jgi:maltose/moltooligosaccharide transporter
MTSFGETTDHPDSDTTIRALASRTFGSSFVWIAAGVLVVIGVEELGLEKEMYLLGGLLIAFGLAGITAIGWFTPGAGLSLRDGNGRVPLPERLGYEHGAG